MQAAGYHQFPAMYVCEGCIAGTTVSSHAVFLYATLTGTSPHTIPVTISSGERYTLEIRHHDPDGRVCTRRNKTRYIFYNTE